MKKLILSILVMMFSLFSAFMDLKASSNDLNLEGSEKAGKNFNTDNVHMYICIQALQLLKDRFPNLNFSELENRIGTMDDQGSRQWQLGKITTGAFREDQEDVIYDIKGPEGMDASCTHFWNADDRTDGDNSLTHLDQIGNFPNAYTKINRYINGDWNTWSNGSRRFIDYLAPDNMIYRFSYNSTGLINFFKTKKIWYESHINTLGETFFEHRYITVSDNLMKLIVFECFGRMCHLLQALTVPAHIHSDNFSIPNELDCYSQYIVEGGYNNFNWRTAKDAGGFINPYEFSREPVRYLMYTATQLADHYPSGQNCLDIPQQHLGNNKLPGGTYPMIINYYQRLGPVPENIEDPYIEGTYCFNYAIRATAGLMYWFAVETGMVPPDSRSLPVINSFSRDLPDNTIYHGEKLTLVCNASGSNLNYSWFYKVCNPNTLCAIPVKGLLFSSQSNKYSITNNTFNNNWTCSYYDSLSGINSLYHEAEPPLNLIAGVRVSNQWGQTTAYYNFITEDRIYPVNSIRPSVPPILGGPVLSVFDGKKYQNENNILHKSYFENNMDITDKLLINEEPNMDSGNQISFAISESDGDRNSFNKLGLLCIDYPENTLVGITESNDIVLYERKALTSPKHAVKSGIDVTKELAYDTSYNNSITGEENEILYTEFPIENSEEIKLFGESVKDSNALIIDPSIEIDTSHFPVQNSIAGNITAIDNNGNYDNDNFRFSGRQRRTEVIIPVPVRNKISRAEMTWNVSFSISFIASGKIYFGGFTTEELTLAEAEHSLKGNIINEVSNIDDEITEMDSNSYITLKFKAPSTKLQNGWKRKYIFVSTGHSSKSDSKNDLQISVKNPENKNNLSDKFKMYQNYPNPFNPKTIFRYELPSITRENYFNVRIRIYDVTGKELMTLIDKKQEPGVYEAEFNGADFPSGIYYYKLETEGFSMTRKMLLLK